jgi:hypothetical protein
MKKLTLLLLTCLALAVGCKKEKSEVVDPDHIQQEIWSIYDSDNNDSYFGIRFYDNSWYRRVILENPSFVTLNNLPMVLNPLNSFYEVKYNNQKTPSGTFVFSDAWKRVFINIIDLPTSIELPPIDTLYRNKDNVVTWIGDPCLGSQEVITFYEGFIIYKTIATTSQAGATSITLKAGSFGATALPGNTYIILYRESTSSLQQGEIAGGKIIRRYESMIKKVYLK